MIKTILPYLLLAVALVLCFMLWQSNRELAKLRIADNSRMQEVIEAKNLYIATIDSGINHLFREARKDSIRYAKKDSASNAKINRLTYKLRLIDTSKSTDKQLDSLINLLYGEK